MNKETKIVKDALDEVVCEIDSVPFIFHNEADVHAILYGKLCYEFNVKYPMPKLKQGKRLIKSKTGNYMVTGLVHCEYYFGKNFDGDHNKKRFDLVIFNENDVENITNHWMTHGNINDYDVINLDHVIEVKLEGGGGGPTSRHFEGSLVQKDLEKLVEFRQVQQTRRGKTPSLYFMYIFRWPTNKIMIRKEIKKFEEDMKQFCNKNTIHLSKSINFFFPLKE